MLPRTIRRAADWQLFCCIRGLAGWTCLTEWLQDSEMAYCDGGSGRETLGRMLEKDSSRRKMPLKVMHN